MASEIRAAASVIAVRDGLEGPEVLVLERGAGSRFLPGYVAFPGGAADAEDVGLAERWFGSPGEAPRACAVRELLEEVGLALTVEGLRPAPHRSLVAVDAAPPEADQLRRIAHWLAPEDVPVRFDAQYFAVAAGPGAEPEADGGEVADAWWTSPRRLLSEWDRGLCRLYWPTYFTMRHLASCDTVDGLLASSIATREPDEEDVARLPRSTFWQDGE